MSKTLRHALEPEVGKTYVTMGGTLVDIIAKDVTSTKVWYEGSVRMFPNAGAFFLPDGSISAARTSSLFHSNMPAFDLLREATPEELQLAEDAA